MTRRKASTIDMCRQFGLYLHEKNCGDSWQLPWKRLIQSTFKNFYVNFKRKNAIAMISNIRTCYSEYCARHAFNYNKSRTAVRLADVTSWLKWVTDKGERRGEGFWLSIGVQSGNRERPKKLQSRDTSLLFWGLLAQRSLQPKQFNFCQHRSTHPFTLCGSGSMVKTTDSRLWHSFLTPQRNRRAGWIRPSYAHCFFACPRHGLGLVVVGELFQGSRTHACSWWKQSVSKV